MYQFYSELYLASSDWIDQRAANWEPNKEYTLAEQHMLGTIYCSLIKVSCLRKYLGSRFQIFLKLVIEQKMHKTLYSLQPDSWITITPKSGT